ncbi:SDR family oxidoreductase [Streptococcus vestibularis]|jgi:NAD(P)H dehydrogenase (quinone)|uniref:SDR family oxidoreductase n=1 Tax=Streptococcus vestibularis TaxID=1343 RepID=UPI00241FD4B4|nr:SDR family oxidoreductase [Streptococcus vestibularis]MBS6505567.1 SDR family oxidoreductase [Streptococcus vestibularis]MCI5925554.1 SDR family oxidoreductase [Streptococcus vestibularis]
MIGMTGVTGKLGSYVADLVDKKGIASVHLARSPERAKLYASAEIRKMVYANTSEVVDALKGIDILLMVSARENPERVKEHKDFLDAAKLAGVEHIVYTSFYGADEKATFTLSRDHAQTEAYIKKLGFTYTFLRDNFYLDFLIDIALENGEIRGPAGSGLVSAVARKDASRVAAEILLNPKEWENQSLNLTGPEDLSMQEIVALLSKETSNAITYVDESIEEAYESRKKWPAQTWEYDAWVSTYTAIKAGEQAGVSTDIEKVLGHPASNLLDTLRDRKLIEEKND